MSEGPERLVTFAAARGVTAMLHPTETVMHTVEAAAEALGIPHDHMTKNLLFIVDGDPVLFVARGASPVDRRRLARHFGVGRKRVRLASAEQTLEMTGYPIGCVPPFGHARPLLTLVEATVLALPRVYGGTSQPETLVSVSPDDFLALTSATVLPDDPGG